MDFDLSEEQKMIQETIRKFAKEEIAHLYLKNMAVQDLISSVMPLWLKRLAEWILPFEARILSRFL
jgi:alkylation response protein AidB-like acyl-CoA dehydrogenase